MSGGTGGGLKGGRSGGEWSQEGEMSGGREVWKGEELERGRSDGKEV